MKNTKKTLISFMLAMSLTSLLLAQEGIVTSGNEATGGGGTVSYSIGQTFYSIQTNSTGEVRQGVQQPYEIYTVSVEDEASIPISLSVYPNPTSDMLTLDLKDNKPLHYKYMLFDMQAKLIGSKTITETQTQLSFGHLPVGTYILNVSHENRVVKVFRIVKN